MCHFKPEQNAVYFSFTYRKKTEGSYDTLYRAGHYQETNSTEAYSFRGTETIKYC